MFRKIIMSLSKILISLLVVILLSSSFVVFFANADVGKKTIAPFVDPTKDPQSYVDRYLKESKYKDWFDKNYGSQYKSIYEAVGLPESKVNSEPKPGYVQLYKDRDYGFALDLFNKWSIDESQNTIVTFYYTGETSGVVMPMFNLLYMQSYAGIASEMNCDTIVPSLQNSQSNQKIIKCVSEAINGGTKITVKLVQKNSFEDKYYKERSNIVMYYKDNGDVYNLVFSSDAKDYSRSVKDFTNSEKSFITFTPSNE